MTLLPPQQVDTRTLVWRLGAPFRDPAFLAAQQARLDALIDAFDREHAPAKAQQHHNSPG